MIDTTPTHISPTSRPQPSIQAIKTRMKPTWMNGDYTRFARYMEPGARQILSEWNIAPGERLLEVGCGSGQIAIPAAEAGVQVTGVDIAGRRPAQMKTASTFATITTALMMVWNAQAAAEGIYDSIAETSNTPIPHTMHYRGPDFGVAELDDAVNDYQSQPGGDHDKPRIPTVTQTTGFGVAVLDEGIHDYSTGS